MNDSSHSMNDSSHSSSIGRSAQSAPALLNAGRRRERYEREYDRVYLPNNTSRGESNAHGEQGELGETDACKQLVNYPRYLTTRVSRASRGRHSTIGLSSASDHSHGGDVLEAPQFRRSQTEDVNVGKIRSRYRDGMPGLTPSSGLRRSNTNERKTGLRKKDPLRESTGEASQPGAFNCVPVEDDSSVQTHQSPQLFVGAISSSNGTRRSPGLRRGRPGHHRAASDVPKPRSLSPTNADGISNSSNHSDDLSASLQSQGPKKNPAPFRRVRTVQDTQSLRQSQHDEHSVSSQRSGKNPAPFRRVRTVQDQLPGRLAQHPDSVGDHGDDQSVSSHGSRKSSAPFRRARTLQEPVQRGRAQHSQIPDYFAPRHDRDSTSPARRARQNLGFHTPPAAYRRSGTATSSLSPAVHRGMDDEGEIDLSPTLPPLITTSSHSSAARRGRENEGVDLSASLSSLNSGVIVPDRASSRSPGRGNGVRRLSQAERDFEAPAPRQGRRSPPPLLSPNRTSVASSSFAPALGVTKNEDEDLSLLLQSVDVVDSILNEKSRKAQNPCLTQKEEEDLSLLIQTLDMVDNSPNERSCETQNSGAQSSPTLSAVLCGTENVEEDTKWIFQAADHKNNIPKPSTAHRSRSVGAVAATTEARIVMPRPSIIRKARSEGMTKAVKKTDLPRPAPTPLAPAAKSTPRIPAKLKAMDQSLTESETIFESSQEYSEASLRPTTQSSSHKNLPARSKQLLASKQQCSNLSVYSANQNDTADVSPTSMVSRLLLKTIGKSKLLPQRRKQQKQADKTKENSRSMLRSKKQANKRAWLTRSKKDSQRLSRARWLDALED